MVPYWCQAVGGSGGFFFPRELKSLLTLFLKDFISPGSRSLLRWAVCARHCRVGLNWRLQMQPKWKTALFLGWVQSGSKLKGRILVQENEFELLLSSSVSDERIIWAQEGVWNAVTLAQLCLKAGDKAMARLGAWWSDLTRDTQTAYSKNKGKISMFKYCFVISLWSTETSLGGPDPQLV